MKLNYAVALSIFVLSCFQATNVCAQLPTGAATYAHFVLIETLNEQGGTPAAIDAARSNLLNAVLLANDGYTVVQPGHSYQTAEDRQYCPLANACKTTTDAKCVTVGCIICSGCAEGRRTLRGAHRELAGWKMTPSNAIATEASLDLTIAPFCEGNTTCGIKSIILLDEGDGAASRVATGEQLGLTEIVVDAIEGINRVELFVESVLDD